MKIQIFAMKLAWNSCFPSSSPSPASSSGFALDPIRIISRKKFAEWINPQMMSGKQMRFDSLLQLLMLLLLLVAHRLKLIGFKFPCAQTHSVCHMSNSYLTFVQNYFTHFFPLSLFLSLARSLYRHSCVMKNEERMEWAREKNADWISCLVQKCERAGTSQKWRKKQEKIVLKLFEVYWVNSSFFSLLLA